MEADGGIAIRSSRRTVFFIFFLVLPLLHSEIFIRSEAAAELPKDELAAFKQVAAKLGASELDFDPCSGGGWNDTSNDLGNGIFCNCSYNNNTVCHITSIVLKEQNFSGTLPPEMAQLKYLQTLDLTRNYINGTIPSTWSSLPLTNLTLHGNRISGSIPREIRNMTLLVTLFLESNELEGTIPEELGNLKNLERLLIGANRFTGRLPVALSKLVNLRDLRVHGNNFSGRIPASIQNLKRLETLMVFGTSLEGPIPDGISLLRNLTDMRIADIISPSSTFPNLTNLVNMKTLILRNCSISDEIPDYVGNMKKLKTLDLSFNKLTGEIPSSFADLKQIGFMYMMSNMLTGSVPVWALKSLKNLDFSNNNFTGASSSSDCGQGSLNLFGSYSSSKDSSIESCLKKDFPCDGVAKFYSLHINCGGKEIPVNGVKYEADLEIKGASTYYLQGNWAYSSSGNFMGDDSDADEYIVTNVSKLSFPAPELYMSARLSPLSLTYYGLCLQNGPYEVKLHFAEIVFTADKTFHSLGRRIFDVYIQGNCVLRDFNIEDEAGGVGIPVVRNFTANVTDNVLRIQFYWAGKGTISIPHRGVYGPLISAITVTPNFTPKNFDVEGSKLPVIATVFIVITACIILFLVIVIIYLKGWLGGKPKEDKELRSRLEQHTGYFTLKQIKSATGNFDQANKIGEGGFGPVYKGVLPDGRVVAVKKLSSKSRQGNREFVNEIGMISAVQHPNLVKLFGCCIEANQLMLIYEYLENNSLGRALFGKPQNRIKLDWPTRRRICIGIGKGLAYLHEESALKVIHRDVKASNVLLDKDLNAKISDFGLAKLHEEGKTHVSTRIAGTVGYMAPEYAMRGYLTDKADVYSFGVVILEMVSGKSNMSFKPLEEYVYLLDWVYVLHEKGSLLELVDPELGTNYPKDEVTRFIKIALLCTSPSTTLRPTMSSVVKMLDGRSVVQDPPPAGSFLSDDWMQKSRQISSDENITSTIEPEYESESSSFLVTEVTNNSTTMFSTKSENMKS